MQIQAYDGMVAAATEDFEDDFIMAHQAKKRRLDPLQVQSEVDKYAIKCALACYLWLPSNK
jgi:hypothetical protein